MATPPPPIRPMGRQHPFNMPGNDGTILTCLKGLENAEHKPWRLRTCGRSHPERPPTG
ncbi:Hypothetical predicted protein, partial [Pelobates cultripes]